MYTSTIRKTQKNPHSEASPLSMTRFRDHEPKRNYYIYNPTTKQFTILPKPRRGTGVSRIIHGVSLALDPYKSTHYKAFCVYFSERLPEHYEIQVYSSDPFIAEVNFNLGVFWNGAINWVSSWGDSLYFNVDEEHLGTMPMPPMPDGWEERRLRYFGEYSDHLHLIEIYGPRTTHFSVYEMAKDYSGWSVKYLVDLDPVMDAFPESICTYLDPSGLHYYKFLILTVIRRDDDDESFLVLNIPGEAIRYNFKDRTFKKLMWSDSALMFGWYAAFHYIESLSNA
ncbi:unnamed protein product [Ilex paraguariensis]|uniref:F-box protein n=1 Tax=Ilex paraguariensis TaxID=185542 RepID=A0ABC8QQZ5_9AQUA